MNKALSLLAVALLLATSGCAGYQYGVSKPARLAKVTKLAVPVFKNDSLIPRIEALTTNALIKKLQISGAYKIVNRDEADAVLKGEIFDIQRSQFRSNESNTLYTAEILMRLRINFTIEDNDGNKLMVGQQIGYSNLVVDTNFQLTQTQVLADAAERFATDMANQITQGW